MQSASVAQSGPLPQQSVRDMAPNYGPQPGNPIAGEANPSNGPPEFVLETPQPEPGVNDSAAPRPNRRARRLKQTKAAIKIASVNMRGFGNHNAFNPQNKWHHVNQVMREKKIAVLLVQETHMNGERQAQVEGIFSRRMKIHSSANPENPTGKGGVAVVLNREMMYTNDSKATVIVPGRAMLVQAKWHKEERLTILVVYAPNDAGDNKQFWETIRGYYRDNPRAVKPDILAGDFNVVEDPIDRLPMHSDRADVVDVLDELKSSLGLIDGWRNTYPSTKAFTYLQSNGTRSQSRIDRIYTTNTILQTAREWKIEPSGIPNADHRMVSVKIVNEDSPTIGKGRWSIPKHLLKDKILCEFIQESGIEAKAKLDRLNGTRTEEKNPQKIFAAFKRSVTETARIRDRAIVPKILQDLRKCEEELERINNDTERPENERIAESSRITEKVVELERKRHMKRRGEVAVRNRLEGETISRYWTQINKNVKPRDVIYALRKPDVNGPEDIYEKSSDRMAELGRNYHENLQKEGNLNVDNPVREEDFKEPLRAVKTEVAESQQGALKAKVTREEVELALKVSKNEKAAGIDGVTYELWKSINETCIKASEEGKPTFDVLDLMTAAFNDIEANGVDKSTGFAEGWMCDVQYTRKMTGTKYPTIDQ